MGKTLCWCRSEVLVNFKFLEISSSSPTGSYLAPRVLHGQDRTNNEVSKSVISNFIYDSNGNKIYCVCSFENLMDKHHNYEGCGKFFSINLECNIILESYPSILLISLKLLDEVLLVLQAKQKKKD